MSDSFRFDRFPTVDVPGGATVAASGWDDIAARLRDAVAQRRTSNTVLVVECYTGVDEAEVQRELERRLAPATSIRAAEAMWSTERIDALVAPFLGGDDPVFGFLSGLSLREFFDPRLVAQRRRQVEQAREGLVLVVGCGASLIAAGDVLVFADLARWEGQIRFRRAETSNLGVENRQLAAGIQYKRAYFVDWRVCDRWKRPLLARADFVLDTNDRRVPKLVDGEAVRRGLRHAVSRPFRVVPYFDPAPWGGHWMQKVFDLDRERPNYGWCFDCVPEENSLLLGFGPVRLEVPALDLVLLEPERLLGQAVRAQFGDEFPIRFDILDTLGGGNLSLQVHPLTEYIRQHFGLAYTQDESYYILDATANSSVYLGLREGIRPEAMARELELAQAGGAPFPAEKYVNRWPAARHDHFLIPAGTIHCSGADTVVLEISATPYIFTFKLWDWGRLGLDGIPRPVHLAHGLANIQWDRTTGWVQEQLLGAVRPVGSGDGWREERTGLHESQLIETRRHWFTQTVSHDTGGGVNVLNLVQGEAAAVESPTGAFAPLVVHYAETFIVPAAVGPYQIRPLGKERNLPHATIKAFVRG